MSVQKQMFKFYYFYLYDQRFLALEADPATIRDSLSNGAFIETRETNRSLWS